MVNQEESLEYIVVIGVTMALIFVPMLILLTTWLLSIRFAVLIHYINPAFVILSLMFMFCLDQFILEEEVSGKVYMIQNALIGAIHVISAFLIQTNYISHTPIRILASLIAWMYVQTLADNNQSGNS